MAEGQKKRFLWSVSDQDGVRLYLLGSIHMAKARLYPLDPAIEEAFDRSTSLLVEVDTSNVDIKDLAEKSINFGMYKTPEETVWDHLDPETTALLKGCLAKSTLNEFLVSRMRPWFLAMTLGMEKLQSLGYDEALGLDLYFIQKAKDKGKPVFELETVNEQFDSLIGFDEIDSVLFLKTTLLEYDQVGEQIDNIFATWQAGDEKGFEELFFEIYRKNPELGPVLKKLIDDRNVKMLERVKDRMAPGQVPFMVVGASHLVGPKGIAEAFRVAGYEVKQL
ncbi:MAG: TraB/GumN family protein [Deltaproteobacteria bacterium]|nr:TraB/GumN family protein [Deltaproteobacteria bacterium]